MIRNNIKWKLHTASQYSHASNSAQPLSKKIHRMGFASPFPFLFLSHWPGQEYMTAWIWRWDGTVGLRFKVQFPLLIMRRSVGQTSQFHAASGHSAVTWYCDPRLDQ